MKTGIEQIAQERQKQIAKFVGSIDTENISEGELIKGALAIIDPDRNDWPSNLQVPIYTQIGYKELIVNGLAIAGALIAAEIDRIQNK